ncbi:MAG: YdbL family protein [Desulfobacterales bacterium]|jgi:uncharacterized protein YdbL (DUF1318 family)
MKQRKLYMVIIWLLVGCFAAGVSAFSADINAIKASMKKRLPVIEALKAKGILGENNRGYLEFVGSKKESADVVAAENKDRKAVYAAIAKQQGTTVEVVGTHRARQIVLKADPGEWLQDANGKWYQK